MFIYIVSGRLVDFCKPIQSKYETAISIVLGRNLDAIIVETEKCAIDCIQFMREQRSGHATFIPLDTIQVKPVNEKLRNISKGARLAVDVITVDSHLEKAVFYACSDSIVVDSMEIARDLSYGKGVSVKGKKNNDGCSCHLGRYCHPQDRNDYRRTRIAII